MSPFLSYSGRGGSHRGRGRGGRGRSGRGDSIDKRTNRGNRKWVRPPVLGQGENNGDKGESKSNILSGNSSHVETNLANATEPKREAEKDTLVPISTYSHKIMKKSGQNKLILSSKLNSGSTAPEFASGESLRNEPQSQGQPATQTLTREGRNKLVSLSSSTSSKQVEQNQSFRRLKNTNSNGVSAGRRIRLAPPSKGSKPTAKRIKLSVQPTNNKAKEEDDTASNSIQESVHPSQTPADRDSEAKQTEKLSDFAYKEVSRVKQRASGRSLRWTKKDNGESSNNIHSDKTSIQNAPSSRSPNKRPKTKNMGLVRVHPNEKTTPICPTFLRGLHCQNEFCRKRHDIPKEYAMPVCSFFQRHGQCLKGDSCVFRHIKLNAKALVCPSFAMLGFCEDEQCPMQHIRGKAAMSALGANGTCIPATEGSSSSSSSSSSSRYRRKQNKTYYRNKSASGDS
eukprot:CAMPEP_0116134116 /NCGR_PEP_ID=MMETSP0329-20121206/10476_1 /TAXON_ID=697910 /ORGANISM="Pseudo-nitzschia arenysensis, Strain B593" /LENGTH=453 /DNA_ID=CAMNT_0003628809 /DNA_START=75 /DNA_END=1436 /DNA_ORIENTATION=+